MMLRIAIASLLSRKWTLLLTVLSLMLGVVLAIGINHIRLEVKQSFNKTLSGTDLIVGSRSSSVNLLLYSVFRIGNATSNMSWEAVQQLAKHRDVEWLIPISLGDSHRGYRVLGTTEDYFLHYQFGDSYNLAFSSGSAFHEIYDVVIGSAVARNLGYKIGDEIILSHGSGKVNIHHHDDKPFRIVGVLRATGTPIDSSIHVSLMAIEAIHVDWKAGVSLPHKVSASDALHHDLTPDSVTAVLVGLKSRSASFKVQRQINQYTKEPLMAILPGIALAELWQMLNMVEATLQLIAIMVLVASFLGMTASLLATLGERQRELAILRSLGASPWYLFLLIQVEVFLLACIGLAGGLGVLNAGLYMAQPILVDQFGLLIGVNLWNWAVGKFALMMLGVSLLLGLIPAGISIRRSLSSGLMPKA